MKHSLHISDVEATEAAVQFLAAKMIQGASHENAVCGITRRDTPSVGAARTYLCVPKGRMSNLTYKVDVLLGTDNRTVESMVIYPFKSDARDSFAVTLARTRTHNGINYYIIRNSKNDPLSSFGLEINE